MSAKSDYESLSLRLRLESKSNESFEIMLAGLSMEELIGLKIEMSARATNQKLFGFKLFDAIAYLAREAVLVYAHLHSATVREAASALGMTSLKYSEALYRYKILEKVASKTKKL